MRGERAAEAERRAWRGGGYALHAARTRGPPRTRAPPASPFPAPSRLRHRRRRSGNAPVGCAAPKARCPAAGRVPRAWAERQRGGDGAGARRMLSPKFARHGRRRKGGRSRGSALGRRTLPSTASTASLVDAAAIAAAYAKMSPQSARATRGSRPRIWRRWRRRRRRGRGARRRRRTCEAGEGGGPSARRSPRCGSRGPTRDRAGVGSRRRRRRRRRRCGRRSWRRRRRSSEAAEGGSRSATPSRDRRRRPRRG